MLIIEYIYYLLYQNLLSINYFYLRYPLLLLYLPPLPRYPNLGLLIAFGRLTLLGLVSSVGAISTTKVLDSITAP